MKTKFYLSFLILIGLGLSGQTATAQTYQPSNRIPVADNTLGTQVSGNGGNFNITGGLNKGQTLFHSFTDFSIPTNGQANFLNSAATRDIITRVTGGLFSDINGTLNSNGANFFLINPNGIVFGNNARLNVGKAFVGSTANSLDLVGGGQTITFGTNPNGDAPLLSVAPNVLFDVARLNLGGGAGAISNFGTLQTTNPNQYIGLIGGNVNLNGGQINASGGRVELGGLSAAGVVGLSTEGNNLRAQFPTNVGRGDVSLTNQAGVDVTGAGGGNIFITARNINLLTGGAVRGGIGTGLGTPEAVAGDLKLDATEKIAVIGYGSVIASSVNSNTAGQGGNLTIDTGSLLLQDGAVIGTNTTGQGNGGNISIKAIGDLTINGNNNTTGISSRNIGQGNAGKITINAQGNISLTNSAFLLATTAPGTNGNSQGISVNAKSLNLSNKSFISSTSFGDKGNAGDITIKVLGALDVAGIKNGSSSGITSTVATGTVGNGGNITVDAGSFSLGDGSKIDTSTSGTGNAGNVTVTTKDAVFLAGRQTSIFSSVNAGGVGNGGIIAINAASLLLKDGAQLITITNGASATQPAGKGDAGSVTIKVSGAVDISGINGTSPSGIFSRTATGTVGKGGNIEINSRNLNVNNGARLVTTTGGKGDAGSIKITATDNIFLDGNKDNISSAALSQLEPSAVGKGGNIEINSRNLTITNGAGLSTTTGGKGDAGNIKITATDNIFLDGKNSGAFSTVAPSGVGKGGEIEINSQNLSVANKAKLNTSTIGQGSAGNIILNINKIVLTGNGNILSESVDFTGGDINITTKDYLLLKNNSLIATDSISSGKNGNGGNITINSPVIVATPGNNDITANASQGAGGNIKITSQGLFGIQYRPKGQESNFTSDITASSTFGRDGAVNISIPGVDPGKDSTQLPTVANDASTQISRVCSANTRQNKLTVTGRGGLPPNANDPLNSDVVWQDARTTGSQPAISSGTTNPVQLAPPAVGWVFNGKGKVTLVAAGTQGQPTGTSVVCPTVVK